MKFLSNLHTHTNYSDGSSTMEEYIIAAINKNFVSLGFSDHSSFGDEYKQRSEFTRVLYPEKQTSYLSEFIKLKEKYKGKIELYISVEEDYLPYSDKPWLDYTIGAVHVLVSPKNGMLYGVDTSLADVLELISHYNNNQEFVKSYYDQYTQLMVEYKPDIGAHIDLINKFNTENKIFSGSDSWYINVVGEAMEKLKKTDIILEINTGGIARANMKEPYPQKEILNIIKELNVPITIASDAHDCDYIDCFFEQAVNLLKESGFRSAKQLVSNKFIDIEI